MAMLKGKARNELEVHELWVLGARGYKQAILPWPAYPNTGLCSKLNLALGEVKSTYDSAEGQCNYLYM